MTEQLTQSGVGPRLFAGARVRHRRYPELTGRIQAIERQTSGEPSAIPYNVMWDDNSLAADLLGWFFIYADDESVEAV